MTSYDYCCDVLIIGSGAAGLTLALRLADRHQITVLSKGSVRESSTLYAQGGIAAVFDDADSLASHISDTLIAGDGLCEQDAVSFIISNAQHCVQWLIDRGMPFDKKHTNRENSPYHLTREAGHSHRRILHRADATGRAVETTLVNRALESPKITIIEYASAVDLIAADKTNRSAERRIVGASIWNSQRQKMEVCRARVVVLATGGAAKVYRYTSNPEVASGDGIAMAWRAGCRVANLEFSQFHPTSLFHPDARNFLLTEALRGEGAVLKRPDGTRFMPEFDRRAELAPRDIVARAIDHEMKRLGADCMYLDISHKPAEFIYAHFPTITEKLSALGFDLTTEPIPVVPAAHYTCGGVMVDQHGRTDVNGLYAIGEVSYTGLHGANRLASNSLLECLVYGWSAATQIDKDLQVAQPVESFPARYETAMNDTGSPVIIRQHLQELRQLMWDDVGIIRTTRQLSRALCRIDTLRQEVEHHYAHSRFCDDVLQLRNLLLVAELIVRCAMQRKESRGLHHTPDYPARLDSSGPTILTPHHRNR